MQDLPAKQVLQKNQSACISAAARTAPAYQIAVFEQNGKEADQRITEIIKANLPASRDSKAVMATFKTKGM